MGFNIKNIFGEEMLSGEADSFKAFVEMNKYKLINADLSGADLTGVNLFRGYLPGAYLYDSNLTGADLSGASLAGANLAGANLADANLAGANLVGANLADANLAGANLNGTNMSIFSRRGFSFFSENEDLDPKIDNLNLSEIKILIDCKVKTIEEWNDWFSGNEEFETKRDTFAFKQIRGMYKAYKAYLEEVYGNG